MSQNHSNILKAKILEAEEEASRENALENADYLLDSFDKGAETAAFYGFLPIGPLMVTKEDRSKASCFSEPLPNSSEKIKIKRPLISPEEKISLFRIYKSYGMADLPHPVMLYFKKPKISGMPSPARHRLSLAIMGSSAGIAEVLMIKASLAILSDHGIKNTYIEINCAGDQDSVCRFEKEITSYYRKNANSIPPEYKQHFKKDIFSILRCEDGDFEDFKSNAPLSMSSLSSQSIQHFKEVLEYLEMLEIPYKINNCLIGHKNYCPHIIFEIKQESADPKKEDKLLVVGHRHNHLSKKIGLRRDIPAITADIMLDKAPSKKTAKRQVKPKFYFVQIGTQAKVKSLNVIESLRKARIHVLHSLTKDKLGSQMSIAENLNVSSLIIMGHKEALEETVVVRDVETRFQETVPISELAKYLKSLKLVLQLI